jgi:hypothetical protein
MSQAIRQRALVIANPSRMRTTAALRSTGIAAGFAAALNLAISAWFRMETWAGLPLVVAAIFAAFLLFSFPVNRVVRGSAWRAGPIFCGIGAELGMAGLLASFCLRPAIGGLTPSGAAAYVALYCAAIAAGRAAGSGLLAIIPARRMIGGAAVAACLLTAAAVGSSGRLALWSLIAAGSVISILLPGVYALGVPSRALLATLAAGSLVPLCEFVLAFRIGVQGALVAPAVCCLYLVFYGFASLDERTGRMAWSERRTSVCSIETPRRSPWLPR